VVDREVLSCKEEAHKSAVVWRNRRYGLRRLLEVDSDMKTVLFFLYHTMEYLSAYESQLTTSQWNKFNHKAVMLDLLFVCDMLLMHCNDEKRLLFIERSRIAILRVGAAFRDFISDDL
jgi:hypothetical protein